MRMRRRGFSMVELMAVVVIIGILAVIALPRFAGTKAQAYDAVMIADLRTLATVQEAYAGEYRTYATPRPDCSIVNDKGEVLWRPSAGVRVDLAADVNFTTPTAWRVQLMRADGTQSCVVAGGDIGTAANVPEDGDHITCVRASGASSTVGTTKGTKTAGGAAADSTGVTPP
jgi:prepilin-type N-terminal cleavage/methylation domain-containing protein